MARRKQINQRKLELQQQLKQQRDLLTGSHLLLRDQLNVSKQLQTSIKNHPKRWFQGGVAAGLGATFLLKRNKKKVVTQVVAPPSTVKGMLFKYAISALKPVVSNIIQKQVQGYVEKKQQRPPSAS